MKYTLNFRSYLPIPNGFEFRSNQTYYFLSTSSNFNRQPCQRLKILVYDYSKWLFKADVVGFLPRVKKEQQNSCADSTSPCCAQDRARIVFLFQIVLRCGLVRDLRSMNMSRKLYYRVVIISMALYPRPVLNSIVHFYIRLKLNVSAIHTRFSGLLKHPSSWKMQVCTLSLWRSLTIVSFLLQTNHLEPLMLCLQAIHRPTQSA